MQNLIASLVIGGGFLSVVYGLYLKYRQAIQKIAQVEAQAKVQGDLDAIAKAATNVQETQRNYDDTVDSFNRNNKPS